MIIQMMTLLHKILTVVILLMIFIVHDHYAYLTQKESAHVGLDFPLPDIVRVFQEQPLFNLSAAVQQNDMLLHHQLVENFCVTFLFSLYGHRCTWREYYLLLDHLRAPFSTLYDPGMGPGFQFDVEVESETETGSGPGLGFESRSLHPPSVRNDRSARGCDEFIYPIHNNSNNNLTDSSLSSTSVMMTAARFHEYVRANQPFVIRNFAAVGATVGATAGAVAGIADMGGGRSDAWPLVHDGSAAATSKKIKRRTATATATTTSNRINVDAAGADAGAWDLSYLKRSMKSSQVVVSATPFGEFDGPEPLSAWGVETTTTTKTTKQKRAIATGTRTAVTTEAAAAAEAAEDSVLIARPAHIQLPFSEFTELLTAPRFQHSREHVALYLEYFPLYAMGEKVVNTTEEPLLVGKLDSQNKKNRKSGKNKSNKKENNGKKRKDKRVRDKSKRDERKTDSDISSSKHMKTNKDSKDSKDKKKKRNTRADRRMASSTSNSSGSLAPPLIYKTTTRHSALQLQVPPIPFAHWLSTDFQLLWMGSGSEYDHSNQTSSSMITSDADVVDVDMDVDIVDIDSMAISKSKVHTSANNNDNIGADTGISFPMTKKLQRNPIGKLHFDRQENLMMMVTGSKTFTLFDPAQSTYLYADIPIRQGNLQVDFNRATGTAVFKREAKAPYYSNEKLSVHAYSPLDIHAEWENLNKKKKQNQQQQGGGGVQSKWPLFQHAVAMKCTVNKVRNRKCCAVQCSVAGFCYCCGGGVV